MLTIRGKFVKALPVLEGDGQRGHWVRGGFVVEYGEEYPKKAAFQLFGEERAKMTQGIVPGAPVEVRFTAESKEYNDKWLTNLNCIGLQVIAAAPMQQAAYPYAAPMPTAPPTTAQPPQTPYPMAGVPQAGQQQPPVQMPGEPDLLF